MSRVRRFLKDNGISVVFGAGFLLSLAGQAIAGCAEYNEELRADGGHPIGFLRYLATSHFAVNVTENWQSEYLQFFLFLFGTVWLLQRGSPESKELHKAGRESDREQRVGPHADEKSPRWAAARGLRLTVYSHSLGALMLTVFLCSWFAQSVAGAAAYSEEQLRGLREPLPWSSYLGSSDFWGRTLQNWQSELLAVGSMAIFAVYLRQRGSPESKPVGAPHDATGVEG